MMLRLSALLHMISCSSDILYTLRDQDALRRFQQYGLSNIYGIKSTLSRREVVPFPLIHTIGTTKRHHYNIADIGSQTISGERNSTVEELLKDAFYPNAAPVPIGKTSRNFPPLRAVSPAIVVRGIEHIRSPSVAVQLVEIRKVKRVGGGYPYGPRNMSIVEFPHPLKVDKYLGTSVAFVTGSYAQRNRSIIDQRTDVWSIKRFDLLSTMKNDSLSCRYCVTYWKMQTKFKPTNVYLFCCK
ncbi:hypothetical protein V3C99_007284 [Haemonchus contortus]